MSEDTRSITNKGQRRRHEIVEGAAAILRKQGPRSVSHRAVAQEVGCSLSAMTYYFTGLDQLLSEAGRVNVALWAARAERVAETAESEPVPDTAEGVVELILDATLPAAEELRGHYAQLIAAGESPPVRRAYRTGRDRLNSAVSRVMRRVRCPAPADLIIAVVDGACVSALSEGRDVRESAADAVQQLMIAASPVRPGTLTLSEAE